MEVLMENQFSMDQIISRLEIQMNRLATIINEQEESAFSSNSEVNFESFDGCGNDEENENLIFNSTQFESSQFEEFKNYESMPKIDHVALIFNESIEKVYKPKVPYSKRRTLKKPLSDFLDQPIKVNMIQELSMTQEIIENRLLIEKDPIDFFLNHLDQNWNEPEYLNKVNELLRSTTNKSTKLEHASESFLEVNFKHNCDENSDYFQFSRPPENNEKFTHLPICIIHE